MEVEIDELKVAATEYLTVYQKKEELQDKKKRLRDTLDSYDGLSKKPREEERLERLDTIKKLAFEMNLIDEEDRKCHLEIARIKQKHIKSRQEPHYQAKEYIDSMIKMTAYKKNNRFSRFFHTLDKDNKFVQYRDNKPIARSIFNIPPSTLPLGLRSKDQQPNLQTGCFIHVDVWLYLFDQEFINERKTLCALRLVSISFAVLIHSIKPALTGYHFVL